MSTGWSEVALELIKTQTLLGRAAECVSLLRKHNCGIPLLTAREALGMDIDPRYSDPNGLIPPSYFDLTNPYLVRLLKGEPKSEEIPLNERADTTDLKNKIKEGEEESKTFTIPDTGISISENLEKSFYDLNGKVCKIVVIKNDEKIWKFGMTHGEDKNVLWHTDNGVCNTKLPNRNLTGVVK